MSLQNLEQIRAANAIAFASSPVEKRGSDGGEAIKKIPPMIMSNGLLAAIAFSIEEKKNGYSRPGYAAILDAIATHLSSPEIGIIPDSHSAADLIGKLTKSDSETLKLATAEALEWLGYARRFVK